MLSPWTVYWVMQMDHIFRFSLIFTVLTGVVAALSFIPWADSWNNDAVPKCIARAVLWLVPLVFALGAATALIPSTKTMCAVLTLPVVVNNQTLQHDATEIYRLGLDRLRGALEIEESVEP